MTKVCNATTGDGAVEPAANDGVVDPEAVVNGGVTMVPVAVGEEMGPDAVVQEETSETGVVAIKFLAIWTLDTRIGTDKETSFADSTELV